MFKQDAAARHRPSESKLLRETAEQDESEVNNLPFFVMWPHEYKQEETNAMSREKMKRQDLTSWPVFDKVSFPDFLFPYHPLYQYVLPCGQGPKFLHKQSSKRSVFFKFKSFSAKHFQKRIDKKILTAWGSEKSGRSLNVRLKKEAEDLISVRGYEGSQNQTNL